MAAVEAHVNGLDDVNGAVTFSTEPVGDAENERTAEQARQLLGDVAEGEPRDGAVQLRSYPLRWLVLAVASLLNMSNTMSWIAYAPVANYVDEFYGGEGRANWLSLVFMICTTPVALVAMWSTRRFGLRSAILLAAWSNGLGALVRLMSSWAPLDSRFAVAMVGQSVAACAYPFIMFLPTKVAGAWFPDTQRALATTVAAMSNPLGVLLANLISPQLVRSVDHVVLINAVTFAPSAFACLLATVGVRVSAPPQPPTLSASQQTMPFFRGVGKLLTSRAYMILFVVLGGGIAMFNTIYTIMQQLLCPMGYTNSFSGACAALMITGGLVGATVSGIIVDRTKLYEETMKIAFACAVFTGIIFAQFSLRPHLHVGLVIVSVLFGVMGLAAYPIGLQMGAECTFPVEETTSTGMVVLSGQIQSAVYIALMSALAKPQPRRQHHLQVCTVAADGTVAAMDMTTSMLVFSAIATLLCCFFLLFFKPKYRRLKLEQSAASMGRMADTTPKEQMIDVRSQATPIDA